MAIVGAMRACDSPVFLDVELRPNPPMNPRVLLWILAVVAAINLAFASYFLMHGAWPVTPFMGADVALLGWAFRASRIAAEAREHVRVTQAELSIEAHSPRGEDREIVLNPYWVRVQLDTPADMPRKLILKSHGNSVQVGNFLGPRERLSFALALKSALNAARTWRPT
ncbi:MAG TPA: DUF2244 domain-containing protein [Rhizomicrobium sp.]